ncbi:MAG: peptide chain release factor 2 [Patescibacteria group bacterium]|nr:peptide chain release factor 2 [Patescibacteria group bacterium]
MNELIKKLEILLQELAELKGHLNLPQKEQKILELEDQMQAPDFWTDNQVAQKTSQEYKQLKDFYDFWQGLEKEVSELLEMARANRDESEETVAYLKKQAGDLEGKYRHNRFLALLSKKYDDHNAIFSLHSGAGGVDAQDWAGMLLRMFLRYCEKRGLSTEVLELSRGEQGGLKTCVVEARGPFAYGLLKSEAGVHRLVRLSPFNPAHTRETSFALMEILPILEGQEELKIDPKDLKIEANTSSGHGGQSVNTTYSAIRITHIPTGIKVSIQNERSQHQNREIAMRILMSKLKALEEERQQAEKKAIRGEFKSAEWGNQIRSYVLHPYKMVKDHRTAYETSDPESVLNGELDEFVEKFLEKQAD